MPATTVDFRRRPFDISNVDRSGKDIARKTYWQLYTVENLVRVFVHSVLSVQVAPQWWVLSVDAKIAAKAARRKQAYLNTPWHGNPGGHEIYYVDISDLNEIVRANSHLFLPIVRDIDAWIARIEQLRVPRNIVAHMNWPSSTDRQRIEVFHADLKVLLQDVASRMSIAIP